MEISVANLSGFDASTQQPMADFSTMPAQKRVLVMMVASEMKPTKAGTGSYLECKFQRLDEGQYKGRNIWTRLNLSNPNKQAEDIASRELGAICKAVGIIRPNDSVELHNKPILIDLGVETSKETGKEQNKIDGYHAVGTAAPAAVPMGAPGAPAATQATTPPWARKTA